MLFTVGFVLGIVSGIISYYFYNHKNEISYSIATIKEDLTTLHIKLDNYLSSQK